MNAIVSPNNIEPLVRLSDLDEYREGLGRRLSNEWDEERWTGYRTRFGVYGQKQPGVQMIRIKIPGGIVPLNWLRTLAEYNRTFCKADLHITTRQDFQSYHVPLEKSADALEFLYNHGLTTREACGNTFRNITACGLAGNCPREHVDAGVVAQKLARTWIRHPLVQHMPRKVKISVSGCATDCALSAIHDLGLIATEKDGRKGFMVKAAGGLGGQPRMAIQLFDFIEEELLPTVVETLARLHQRYSDRVNRNASRVKFLVKRFGEQRFLELYMEEFERLRGLPQRPWEKLEWRQPGESAIGRTPVGVVRQHDGRFAVIGNPPLGLLSSDQTDEIADIAEYAGLKEVRTMREQNIMLPDVEEKFVAEVVKRLRAIGLVVAENELDNPDVVSCPGTTSCRIGITNSQNFGRVVEQDVETDPTARGIMVRISGCHNACGQHHIGDFGFHGMAKKVNGRPAPHYQIHIGGDGFKGKVGMLGPIVAARHGIEALRLLRRAYSEGKQEGEGVRAWADRLGKPGLASVVAKLTADTAANVFFDWGEDEEFKGAPTESGECAAPFAPDDLLADLANDALIRTDRFIATQRLGEGALAAEEATMYAARRVLHHVLRLTKGDEPATEIFERLRAYGPAPAVKALEKVTSKQASGDISGLREATAFFLDTSNAILSGVSVGQEAAE